MAKDAFRFSGDDAINYEKYLGPLLFEPSAVELLNYLGAPDLQSVLEIAGGTGRLTSHLRSYFPASTELVVSDISPDMLEVARGRLGGLPIDFRVADAQALPFPDASFDLVVCQYGLMFLPDKEKGCAEIFRVLRPGGRCVFSTWDKTENMPLLRLVFDELVIPFFEGEDITRFRVPFSMYDPAVLEGLLEGAGFTGNRVFSVDFRSGAASPEDIVNGFFLKHPLGRAVAEKDPEAVQGIAAEMLERIKARLGEGDIVVDLRAWIGIGQKVGN